MATSTLKTRIKHKIDTASNWASSSLIPLEGELIIYKGDKPQIKVGDGITAVGNLSFIKAGSDTTITQTITSGTQIASISIDGAETKLYAPSSIAWDNITGKPSTFVPSSHTHSALNHSEGSYLTISTNVRPIIWIGGDNGNSFALEKYNNEDNLTWHNYIDGEYSQTRTILDEDNYTSYTVTKTGSGASGTWGISISGNAETATTALYTSKLGTSDNNAYISMNNDAAILFCQKTGGITNWAIERHGTGEQLGAHFYNTTDGSWVSNHILLDHFNYQYYALPLSGGTLTGTLNAKTVTFSASSYFIASGYTKGTAPSSTLYRELLIKDSAGSETANNISIFGSSVNTDGTHHAFIRCYAPINGSTSASTFEIVGYTDGTYKATCSAPLYGAVWNDYAEYRQTTPNAKPGQIVAENGDGTQHITTKRLEPGCNVVSDTFGFAIGQTDECDTPIACAGRALVYTYQNRNNYPAGAPVCSAPNGTVDIMTREEIMMYPECIVGYVSEIPEYERWGSGDVEVDGRIWIKVV